MTFCCLGNVVDVASGTAKVTDSITGEQYEIVMIGEGALNIQPGVDAIFVGEIVSGIMRAKKIEISKFLNPLYEDDLFDSASSFNLIAVIDDPFPQIYMELMNKVNND